MLHNSATECSQIFVQSLCNGTRKSAPIWSLREHLLWIEWFQKKGTPDPFALECSVTRF